MSAQTSVQARVEQFLVERRGLGFSIRNDSYVLRSFTRHIQIAMSNSGTRSFAWHTDTSATEPA